MLSIEVIEQQRFFESLLFLALLVSALNCSCFYVILFLLLDDVSSITCSLYIYYTVEAPHLHKLH